MSENRVQARNITIRELWIILTRKIWIICLAAAIGMGGVFLYSFIILTPLYESTATLYVLPHGTVDQSEGSIARDFSFALEVMNDCAEMLKMHSVIDMAIDELGLDVSYDSLCKHISVLIPENSRILKVSAEAESSEKAKEIVDSICRIGANKIENDFGFELLSINEYGLLENEPSNRIRPAAYVIAGIAAAAVAYIVLLFYFIFDGSIHTDEDVERYLSLSVLGTVPCGKENPPCADYYICVDDDFDMNQYTEQYDAIGSVSGNGGGKNEKN